MSEEYKQKIKESYHNQLQIAIESGDKKKEKFLREKLRGSNLFSNLKAKPEKEELHKPGNIGKRGAFCERCNNILPDRRYKMCEDCRNTVQNRRNKKLKEIEIYNENKKH